MGNFPLLDTEIPHSPESFPLKLSTEEIPTKFSMNLSKTQKSPQKFSMKLGKEKSAQLPSKQSFDKEDSPPPMGPVLPPKLTKVKSKSKNLSTKLGKKTKPISI